MPDEPEPVGGLAASSGPSVPHAPRGQGEVRVVAGGSGALATRAVAAHEAHRRELIEAIRTPIITASLAGRITGFNAAAVALFGSPARLYGRGIRDVLPFAPEPRATTSGDAQGMVSDANGRTVDLEVSRSVMDDGLDQGYAVYVVHDISRHAEVNRLREQLLYSVAHELRGPLMVLDNALEIVEADYPRLTAEEFSQLLRTARRTARRMRTLMEDLLSAGSIQSGHFVVAPRQTELRAILGDALEIVNPALEARGQRVEIDVPRDAPLVMADRRYARQVLTNLLANASKYSPEASVIRVLAAGTATMLRISVEDQGPGIAAEQQTSLFERFYRVRTDNDAPGVGLGLAIAKGIVEAHGGSIGIDSQPGSGTRVWFTLPSAARQADDARELRADSAR